MKMSDATARGTDCAGLRRPVDFPGSSGATTRIRKGVGMSARNGISRRHALGMAAAIGGLAMSGGASAQAAKRIEQLAPQLEKIISPSEPIHDLAEGFCGGPGRAERPGWWQAG